MKFGICYDDNIQDVDMTKLPCDHTLCTSCCEKLTKKICPFCRNRFSPDNKPNNYINILDNAQEQIYTIDLYEQDSITYHNIRAELRLERRQRRRQRRRENRRRKRLQQNTNSTNSSFQQPLQLNEVPLSESPNENYINLENDNTIIDNNNTYSRTIRSNRWNSLRNQRNNRNFFY